MPGSRHIAWGASFTWSVLGALAAGTALPLVVWLKVPDQLTHPAAPALVVAHAIGLGTLMHLAALLPIALVAAGLVPERPKLGFLPRAIAMFAAVAPPVLTLWMFGLRTGRLDAVTFLGAAALAAGLAMFSRLLAELLAPLDRAASTGAPLAGVVVLAAVISAALPAVLSAPFHAPEASPALEMPTVFARLPRVETPRKGKPRTVLLFTVDTLRADHLGAWGYPRSTSPVLDALAESGLRGARLTAASSGTVPSFGAIHTGLAPDCSGVAHQLSVVGDGVDTLAERFREGGYQTLAVVTNHNLDEKHGFHQGYDHFTNLGQAQAAEVVDAAISQWEPLGDQPVFAWVHLFDPHTPYIPPEEAYAEFGLDQVWRTDRLPVIHFGSWGGVNAARTLGRPVDADFLSVGELVARYDGEIAHADEHFGRILEWLDQSGRLDDAVVMFTSDHGETLARHPSDVAFQHAMQVYQDDLHVPLVLWGPGRIPTGVAEFPIRHIDLLPTLLGLAELPADDALEGQSILVDGARPAVSFATSAWWDALSLRLRAIHRRAPSRAVLHDGWKLIVHPQDGLADLRGPFGWVDAWRNTWTGIWQKDKLYAHSYDPAERLNLLPSDVPTARELKALLAAELARSKRPLCAEVRGEPITLDDETREALRAMGYLD